MHVVIADPPAYTPPYDRALAGALAAAGAEVELVTSRFRFGAVAAPNGYRAAEWFYPVSSRMGSTRLRLAVKAVEHPLGMARFTAAKPDVLHVQWFGAPELDRWLFRPRSPVVFTAHDIIPRRTASKTGLWRTLFGALRARRRPFGAREGRARRLRHRGGTRARDPPPRLPWRDRPPRRRADGAPARAHPAVQGRRGRGRGRSPRPGSAAPRRGRSARAARRRAP